MDFSLWNWVVEFSRSNAFSALVAGVAGAYFGAMGAQHVISKEQKRQAVVSELNSINAAISLCFSISNTFLNLKRQHVRMLWANYNNTKQEFEAFQVARAAHTGPKPPVFDLKPDLQSLPQPQTPTVVLERIIFEKISLQGRGLAAAVELAKATGFLGKSIEHRNEAIHQLRQAATVSGDQLERMYLAAPDANGAVDANYQAALESIHRYTDACIFFSMLLATDLGTYGSRFREQHLRQFAFRLPTISTADWSQPEEERLIPNSEEYTGWLKGFETNTG